jgi:GcrA cell cycle regulator
MSQQQKWTPEAVETIRTLWPDHSAAVIAARLNGGGFVVTRNAVIGKAHRLGLEKGAQNVADNWRRAL